MLRSKGIDLNKRFISLLRLPFTLVTEPSFSLTVFRLEPSLAPKLSKFITPQSLNDLNREFYSRISARVDILLTQTVINGIVCIRFAVGAPRTEERHVDQAWAILQREAEASISAWVKGFKPGLESFYAKM